MDGAAQPQQPAIPDLRPVESSHLTGAAHDAPTKTLFVGFHDSSVYAYHAVPEAVYQALVSAKSAGQYFNARVRGQFRSSRLKAAPSKAPPPVST